MRVKTVQQLRERARHGQITEIIAHSHGVRINVVRSKGPRTISLQRADMPGGYDVFADFGQRMAPASRPPGMIGAHNDERFGVIGDAA